MTFSPLPNPEPPDRLAPVLLAERARQAAHLARGGHGVMGTMVRDGAELLWCRRDRATMRSLLASVIPAGPEGRETVPLESLLSEFKPDSAILRVIGGPTPRWRIALRRGALFVSLGAVENHEILPLPGSFDAFLAGLGKTSRAHIRSSLRDFARRGIVYSLIIDEPIRLSEELLALADHNMPRPIEARRVGDFLRHANAQERPFTSSLRLSDGRLISAIFGYVTAGHAVVISQFNAADAPKIGQAGCSLLHRALLIRRLTEMNLAGLIVVNGCNGMLRPYCRPVHAQTYLTVALHPLSWLRWTAYMLMRPYLWAFVAREWPGDRPR